MIGKRRGAPVRARAAFFISPRNFCAALRRGVRPDGLTSRRQTDFPHGRTVKRRARLRAERQGGRVLEN